MKILTYSDIHLEFAHGWTPPAEIDGDILILAGDIVSFKDYNPLSKFLRRWQKPVLYVAGNHEYYTRKPIDQENAAFQRWLAENHPNVIFLLDEAISLNGVNFFGGTMWTNFNSANPLAMETARREMNDFRLIMSPGGAPLKPFDTIAFHDRFVRGLLDWFAKEVSGPRVVISHHAPAIKANTQHGNSPLMPAFNSLDMIPVIEQHQPALWVYGHTHECDDQMIGKTRIISNQLGYPNRPNGFECSGFDSAGLPAIV